jgi:hypothetical protein
MKFITGNSFKELCHYIIDEHGVRYNNIHNHESNILIFVKTDYIHTFFNSDLVPNKPFYLITHNSDYSINKNHSPYLEKYTNLLKWYAQNVDYEHEKLIPIPIGIANPEWPHGNTDVLDQTINTDYKKEILMYANFNINTNRSVRQECLRHISAEYVENNVPLDRYLINTSKAYFSICPMGNGIDSHRIWESLYLRTVPVVEDTYNIRCLQKSLNLPIVMIKNWNELTDLNLNIQLYNNIIDSFNPNILTIENCISL